MSLIAKRCNSNALAGVGVDHAALGLAEAIICNSLGLLFPADLGDPPAYSACPEAYQTAGAAPCAVTRIVDTHA